jgi:hypothetical protein
VAVPKRMTNPPFDGDKRTQLASAQNLHQQLDRDFRLVRFATDRLYRQRSNREKPSGTMSKLGLWVGAGAIRHGSEPGSAIEGM